MERAARRCPMWRTRGARLRSADGRRFALRASAHRNVAVVAFANKLARIAWAVLRRGESVLPTGGMSVAA